MGQESDRFERYLETELESCRPEDIDERLENLSFLQSTADSEHFANDLSVFSTLGDETRYRLLRVLVDAQGELCVCELDAVVSVSESAISHALGDLREAGLVARRKNGRWRMYQSTTLAESLLEALEEVRE